MQSSRSSEVEPLAARWAPLLSDAALLALAGTASFARGQRYHAEGRCRPEHRAERHSRWQVQGTERYRVALVLTDVGVEGQCSCPYAAEEEQFCKHLVAAALTWREGGGGAGPEADPSPARASPSSRKRDALRAFLQTRSAAELAERLGAWAEQDRVLQAQLRGWQAQVQAQEVPDGWKEAVDELLRKTRDFYDWNDSREYARRGQQVLPLLRTLAQSAPAAAREACVAALRRIFKVGEQADDSGGHIGDLMHGVHDTLLLALAAAPPAGADAARWLRTWFDLQDADPWGLWSDEAMVEAAGPELATLYGERVARDWADWLRDRPPPPVAGGESTETWDSVRWRLRSRYLADLRRQGDQAALLDAIRSDLAGAGEYLELASLLEAMGRQREALQQLETADRQFRHDHRVEAALLQAYGRDGCREEVLALRRRQLERHPDVANYQAALEAARDAGRDLEAWRAELHGWAEQRELLRPPYRWRRPSVAGDPRDVSVRVRWLVHDGRADAALGLVRADQVEVADDALLALGQALREIEPTASVQIMRRLVVARMRGAQSPYRDQLALVRAWLGWMAPVQAREQLAWLRAEYRAKRNFVAGLPDLG